MATYAEQLLSPHWQRKRLEVMERDNFKCMECGDSERTLHVHHIKYIIGRQPWDYPNENFKTLCELCHTKHHKKEVKNFDITKQIPVSVHVSISNTIQDFNRYLETAPDSTMEQRYFFLRSYQCSAASPAPDKVVVASALSAIYQSTTIELKNELSDEQQQYILRKCVGLMKLRTLLVKEYSITNIIRL